MIKKILTLFILIGGIVCITNVKNNSMTECSEVYIYKGNTNAEGIEIDEVICVDNNSFNVEYLELIKFQLLKNQFSGIDIKIIDIENDILTIDLVDKEKYVVEYINMGSSGSKICSDILQYSFLQPESNIKKWPEGLKILVNGKADAEGDHFNFNGIYKRESKDKTLATIKDYGYVDDPAGYDEEYFVNPVGQRFVIEPIDNETEIIISEAIYSEYGFYEGKELYKTNKSLLFVVELPEGMPTIIVKLKKGDRTSTWLPTYNGKDGSLIVPLEYKII